MTKAFFKDTLIAQSDWYIEVEGNVYFPPEALNREYLKNNEKTTHCGWKGTANYYDVVVNGTTANAAAWYYPEPLEEALKIKDHVAFGAEIQVEP